MVPHSDMKYTVIYHYDGCDLPDCKIGQHSGGHGALPGTTLPVA